MERLALSVWLTVVAGTLAVCADDDQVAVPAGSPKLPVPAGNMLSEARVAVGKRLFYDKPASGIGAVVCASCPARRLGQAVRIVLGAIGSAITPSLGGAGTDQRGADGTRASAEANGVAEPVDIAW